MGVIKKCSEKTTCCFNSKGEFGGCYDPSKCEDCIDGTVILYNKDKMYKDCKKCTSTVILNPFEHTKTEENYELESICESWELCCHGKCYDPICEKCNETRKIVEDKCKNNSSTSLCCKKGDGTSVGSCYDPKDCEDCDSTTGTKKPKDCGTDRSCCLKTGKCYRTRCENCDQSTGAITPKYDFKKCEQCDDSSGDIISTLTESEKENCWGCDKNGAKYRKCTSDKCCNGECFDSPCKICVDNKIQTNTEICGSEEECCNGQCITVSETSCKNCITHPDGKEEVNDNKCEYNEDGSNTNSEKSCCNGTCFDDTCKTCENNTITIDDNSGSICCNGIVVDNISQKCCDNVSINKKTIYKVSNNEGCCKNELDENYIYNTVTEGCCSYGENYNSVTYNKETHGCCAESPGPDRTYSLSDEECCSNKLIIKNKYKNFCCSDGSGSGQYYSAKRNCEECNGGTPKKLYDDLCKICKENEASNQPDELIDNKCNDRKDGKIECCPDGQCYSSSSKCETCDKDTKTLTDICRGDNKKCCGVDGCYDDSTTSCEDCIGDPNSQGGTKITKNKCANKANSIEKKSLSTGFKYYPDDYYKSGCCNGECYDTKCQECESDSLSDKCPTLAEPRKSKCARGAGCYDPICQNVGINNDGVTIILNKGTCTCCEPSNSDEPSECCDNKTQRCCSFTKKCVPKEYVDCENQCVSPDLCCGTEIVASKSECCNGEKMTPGTECCNDMIIDSTKQCCKFPNSSTEYAIPVENVCCQNEPNGCDPGQECCYEEGSVDGGCLSTNECKKCKNGNIITDLTEQEECCAGIPISKIKCDKCVDGVKKSFKEWTTDPNSCLCYEGEEKCFNGTDCFSFRWAKSNVTTGERASCTLTIPNKYSSRINSGGLVVNVSGAADDELWINGENRGTAAEFDLILTSSDITIEFRDTVGGNVGGGVCVCIKEGFSSGPPKNEQLFPVEATGTNETNGWRLIYPSDYSQSLTEGYQSNRFRAGGCL